MQGVLDAFLAVAAVGGDGAWRAPGSLGDPPDRRRQLRRVGRVAHLDGVIDDDAVLVVGDLSFVAELDRLAQAALGDRAGIAIMQADPPSGAVGDLSGHPLAGLRGDLAGRGHQLGKVVDRAHQPATPPPRRRVMFAAGAQRGSLRRGHAHRPLGVNQQPLGIACRGFGQSDQLTGALEHRGRGLVAAQCGTRAQFRCDRIRALARRPGPIPHPGAHRPAGRLDPLTGRGDPPHRLGQQTRVGRIGHVGRHHRRVGPHPVGAQQLRLGRLGQQRLVEPAHRPRSAAPGQLHQRGRMRHRHIQRDPAEHPPGDRVRDLPTQALITQPIAKLQKHQPQIDLHRRRGPANRRGRVLKPV
ncbi:Uncharacterised protein [Mycobacteroides abscessus subsp. abscessus]|nr:Uncharacterised protein [Mycobacteroides abscessus subsp. abscessus]SHY67163.1 Uncharacterised protein [Mycobacteroides abscessus subsp. abscessus]SIB65992.1 Uncharacterised protein [Mycobacteroides abscessus subsp. abscessus]SIC65558.1 Uncharacterised protein [Mycobacteroides abscessus subsp. abscessus]SID38195.1 Uncharacterised protein [Mycobacteroides abscessus subsp. abscessus]